MLNLKARLAALLGLSGLCALVYQGVWIRELRLVFGASTAASAAVLALFMGGLGLGGWWLGRRAERHANPLRLYAQLELAIAATAAVTPFLVQGIRALYLATGGSARLGSGGATALRLLLSAVVLGATTVLMGGTLPAAARAVERAADVSRRAVAVLFGLNTLGAVLGVGLSTFFLLEAFGQRTTLWLACALNALVGWLALEWSRRPVAPPPPAQPLPLPAAAPARLVLAAALVVGFAFMAMEQVWYRMLAPLLGGSTYTLGLVLMLALLGIGVGGAAYAVWGSERRATLRALALTCGLEALYFGLPLVAGDDLAVLAAMLRSFERHGFAALVGSWALVAAPVVLPGAIAAGYQFPLLIALLGRGDERVGAQVGLAYAWNTAGSIAGALAAGFLLVPGLGAVGTWRLVVALLAALAGVVAVLAVRRRPRALALPLAVAALALGATARPGPSAFWRHSPIGAGRAVANEVLTRNALHARINATRRAVYWERDGVESSVGLWREHGLSFIVNGKSDGHVFNDAGTQVMGGLLGAALHANPRRALVIGLGTGSTAGWLAKVPGVERVDVVEIEPAILEVARSCAPVNGEVLSNPKVHVFLGDAREFLLSSRDDYDIIFSEPSNPYRAGISSLYTREFYQAVRSRLGPRGLLLQWLQAYEVQTETVRTVLATVGSVLPEAEVWRTQPDDLIIVASASPIPHDVPTLRARLAQEPFATAIRVAWHVDGAEGFYSRFVAGAPLVRELATTLAHEVNTDDQNRVEFAFARSVGRRDEKPTLRLFAAAVQANAARPAVSGELDWDQVVEERLLLATEDKDLVGDLPGSAWRRLAFFTTPKPPGEAARLWAQAPFQPRGTVETLRLADELSTAGLAQADAYVEGLRPGFPVEALVFTAQARQARGDVAGAGEALLAAFEAQRLRVWSDAGVFGRGLLLVAPALARRDAALGQRLFDALAKPFPVFGYELMRLRARASLAEALDFPRLCAEALAPWEPWPEWTRESLSQRVQCARATSGAAFPAAERDMQRYLEAERAR